MEVYLRISLLFVTAIILILLLVRSRSKQVSQLKRKDEPFLEKKGFDFEKKKTPSNLSAEEKLKQDLVVISVLAKSGCWFSSYDLFQAISATGMQFGEMDIFHYYLQKQSGKVSLFSLLSITKPGHFDLNKIGDFSCAGLTLFMNIREVSDPEQVFELMLKTAEQLAEDLGGELRAGQINPWNEETLSQYREKVAAL